MFLRPPHSLAARSMADTLIKLLNSEINRLNQQNDAYLTEISVLEAMVDDLASIKDSPQSKDLILQAIVTNYYQAYAALGAGGTVKGKLLLTLESVFEKLNTFQHHRFYEPKKFATTEAAIFSLVSSPIMTVEKRQEIVKAILEKTWREGFIPAGISEEGSLAHKRKLFFVKMLKAVVRMGEEAIDVWNHLIVNLHRESPSVEPLLDLLITSINRSEKDFNALYDKLVQNNGFRILVDQVINNKQPSIVHPHTVHEEKSPVSDKQTDGGEKKSVDEVNKISAGVDKKKLVEKSTYQLTKAVDEFYSKIKEGLYKEMQSVAGQAERAILELKEIDPKAAVWLEFYLKPYRSFDTNPFVDPGSDKGYEERISAITTPLMTQHAAVQKSFAAFEQANFNYEAFNTFLVDMLKKKKIQSHSFLNKFFEQLNRSQAIIPIQYGPRYEMMLKAIQQQLSLLSSASVSSSLTTTNNNNTSSSLPPLPPSSSSSFPSLQTEVDDALRIVQQQVSRFNENLRQAKEYEQEVKKRMDNFYIDSHLEILIDMGSKASFFPSLVAKLKLLNARKDISPEQKSAQVHHHLLAAYVQALLAANGEEDMLVKSIAQAIKDFHKITGSHLLGDFPPSVKAGSAEFKKILFSTVKNYPQEAHEFAQLFYHHAITKGFIQNSTSAACLAKAQALYVRDALATIAMGPEAIKTWNQLVTESDSPRWWVNLCIRNNTQASELSRLHSDLAKCKAFPSVVSVAKNPALKEEVIATHSLNCKIK